MKKGIYIIYGDLDGSRFAGVNTKIKGQIKAFANNGIQVKTKIYNINDSIKAKILYRLPFVNREPRWEYSHDFDNCDFIYMRKPYLSFSFIRFIKLVKKKSKAKIIVEFPTYPYDRELKERIIDYPLFIEDYIARQFLKGKIDRIANLTDERKIFGVPTLKIINGYDFSQIFLTDKERDDDEIRLCCVARFMPVHGYERILNGLADYYDNGGDRNVTIYMVGKGRELKRYQAIVKDRKIDSHVVFYGFQPTEKIGEILNKCDFGVGAIGMYKLGFHGVGAYLKTREYLAAGLPVIASNELDFMQYPELRPYALIFANDQSNIEINEVIDYYDSLHKEDINRVKKMIREAAVKYLDASHAMDEVIEYIKET